MRGELRITVAQPRLVSNDVAGNVRVHAAVIRDAQADVVVFPELSLTGYELDAPTVSPFDDVMEPIVDACAATGAVALVGAPAIDDWCEPTIATLAFSPDGVSRWRAYEKQWLGDAETERFVPGRAPATIEVLGWRLGLAICKDTRIPQHAAATAALGMDLYVAGITEADPLAPEQRARRVAAEHGVWVAIASFAGPTGGGFERTAGRSGIWRPDGTAVAQAGAEPGEIVRATLR